MRGGGDDTHGCRVAGTSLDLETIRERKFGRVAEVDKVVGGRQGRDLAPYARE